MSGEKLTELMAVFKLETAVAVKGIKLGAGTFDKVEVTTGITSQEALSTILLTLEKLGIQAEFTKGGETINVKALLQSLKGGGKWGYVIACADLEFSFARNAASEYAFVHIKEKKAGASKSWDSWMEVFASVAGFSQAWVADVDYQYWQNAADLLQYKTAGRDTTNLPIVSNGLPRPLLRDIVDTSRNPGRRIIRKGFFEAVGATMWLSDIFFALTKGAQNRDAVLGAAWINSTILDNGVIKLQAHPILFDDESTAPIQDRLRSLLYP